jgi:hypothetical protein
MHERDLQALVIALDSEDADPELRLRNGSIGSVLEEIIFHAQKRYWQFTPTLSDAPPFLDRLWNWLNNPDLTEHDVITLLKSVPALQFVDRDDMLAL